MTSVSLPSAFHVVSYHDAERGLDFLHRLGFDDVWIARDDDGRLQHAEVRWPHGVGALMIGQVDTDEFARPGTGRVYLVAAPEADLDRLYATALESGASVARPIGAGPAGGQVFAVFDPEGNEFEIGHYTGGGMST